MNKEIINEIVGKSSEDFLKWIKNNYPKDNMIWLRFVIQFNLLDDYKDYLISNHPIFFFPKKTIQYGMITNHQDLYNLIFLGNKIFDWKKASIRFDKWLKIQNNKNKDNNGNVGVKITEYNLYFVLYKTDSILCNNLAKMLYLTLKNIKNKTSVNTFNYLLKNKVYEMFYRNDIHFMDSLSELMVLNYYLNEGYILNDVNNVMKSGRDLEFSMYKDTEVLYIEVVNKYITKDKSNDLRNYLEKTLRQKWSSKNIDLEKKKNTIICQTLTPDYSNFNEDLIEIQKIYKTPFNLDFMYNTFCFFVSDNEPCFMSLKDNKVYKNNFLLENVILTK